MRWGLCEQFGVLSCFRSVLYFCWTTFLSLSIWRDLDTEFYLAYSHTILRIDFKKRIHLLSIHEPNHREGANHKWPPSCSECRERPDDPAHPLQRPVARRRGPLGVYCDGP